MPKDTKINIDVTISTEKIKEFIKEVNNTKKQLEELVSVAKSLKSIDTEFQSINKTLDTIFGRIMGTISAVKRGANIDIKNRINEVKKSLADLGDEYSKRIDLTDKFVNTLNKIGNIKFAGEKESLSSLLGSLSSEALNVYSIPQLETIRQAIVNNIGRINKEIERAGTVGDIERVFGKLSNAEKAISLYNSIGSSISDAFSKIGSLEKSISDTSKIINFGNTFSFVTDKIKTTRSEIEKILEPTSNLSKKAQFRQISETLSGIFEKVSTPEMTAKLTEMTMLPKTALEAMMQQYGTKFGTFLYTKGVNIAEAREAVDSANKWLQANKELADPALVRAVSAWRNQMELAAHGLRAGEISIRNFTLSARILKEDIKDLVFWQARWYGTKFLLFLPVEIITDTIRSIRDYKKELAIVQGVTLMSDKELKGLDETIRNLGSRFAFSFTEIAKASLELAKAGLSGEKLNLALEETLKLGKATNTSLTTAASIMISGISAWNLSAEDIKRFSNAVYVAANETKLDVSDLATSFNYLGGVVGTAKIKFEDFLAVIAGLSQFMRPSTAATGLNRVISDVMKTISQPQLEQSARIVSALGSEIVGTIIRDMTFEEADKVLSELRNRIMSGDLLGLINQITSVIKKPEDIIKIFGSFDLRAGINISALNTLKDKIEDIRKKMEEYGRLSEAVNIVQNEFSSQAVLLSNNLKLLLLPALSVIFSVVTSITKAITFVVKAIKEFWYVFAGIGVALALANLSSVITQLKTIYGVIEKIVKLLPVLWTKMGPIGWAILGGMATATIAKYLMDVREEMKTSGEYTKDIYGALAGSVGAYVEEELSKTEEKIKNVGTRTGESFIEGMSETIKRDFNKVISEIDRNLSLIERKAKISEEARLIGVTTREKLGIGSFSDILLERRRIILDRIGEIRKGIETAIKDLEATKTEKPEDTVKKQQRLEEYKSQLKDLEVEAERIRKEIEVELELERRKVIFALEDLRKEFEIRSIEESRKMLENILNNVNTFASDYVGIFGNMYDIRTALTEEIYQKDIELLNKQKEREKESLEFTIANTLVGKQEYEKAVKEREELDNKYRQLGMEKWLEYNNNLYKIYSEYSSRQLDLSTNRIEKEIELFKLENDIKRTLLDREERAYEFAREVGVINARKLYEIQKDLILKRRKLAEEELDEEERREKEALRKEIMTANLSGDLERYEYLVSKGWEELQRKYENKRIQITEETNNSLLELQYKYVRDVEAVYERAGMFEALKASFEMISVEYMNIGSKLKSLTDDIARAMTSSFETFLDYTSDKFLDWHNLVISILQDVYKAVVRSLIIEPFVGSILGFAKGTINSFINRSFLGTAAYTPPVAHSGGFVKFHVGGLNYDEVPAILQKGEYVVSRKGVELLDKINSGNILLGHGVKVSLIVNNNTGVPVEARQQIKSPNPQEAIVTLWLDALERNAYGLRTAIGK